MRDVSEIPESWKQELLKIRQTFPQAVIAGGCLRDWFIHRTRGIKDIDIFLPGTTDDELSSYLNDGQITVRNKTKNYGNLSNDDINSVFSTSLRADNLPIELIAVTVPLTGVLERFDFGICQIMFDGETISYTDQFIHDIENCCFTLVRADNTDQYARSKRRFERLTESKYPGYTFNPGNFKHYEPFVDLNKKTEMQSQKTVYLGIPNPYEETGPCTGPTGNHEFAIGSINCVFCDRARLIL